MMMMIKNVIDLHRVSWAYLGRPYHPVWEEGHVLKLHLRSSELKCSPGAWVWVFAKKSSRTDQQDRQPGREAGQDPMQQLFSLAIQSSWVSCYEHQLVLLPFQWASRSTGSTSIEFLGSYWSQFPAESQTLSEPRPFIWVAIDSLTPGCRLLLPPVPWILLHLEVPLPHFPLSQQPWLSNLPIND